MSTPVRTDERAARYKAAMRSLYARIDYERVTDVPYTQRQFKLDRMHRLLARLDDPQEALPIVHVAGTKGKGSTAAMIGSVMSSAGYRTGVFSSPHLDRIEQRMAIDGRPCSSSELVELVDRLMPAVRKMDKEASASGGSEIGPTYFEIVTAMALLHFAAHRVDMAVLEVGLGGRLDSTNVCRPRLSVITSISFDHTRQLGNTLELIAREKAGVVKPGVPVISGVVGGGPREVIRRICRGQGCRLVELGPDFDFRYDPPQQLERTPGLGRLDFVHHSRGSDCSYRDLGLGLLGRHQAANAAVALAVLGELRQAGWKVPEQAIRSGLARLDWPARVELLARRPAIIVDAAHNAASVDALLVALRESFSVRRRLLIFSTTREKDAHGMLARLLGQFGEVILTRYLDNPRAVPPEELDSLAAGLGGPKRRVCADPAAAWQQAAALAGGDDLICVTGSFYIAAEMRRLILARPLPPRATPESA